MVRNYLIVAFRNIFRNKLFSTVNILGLAFGMCSALLIFLWVNDELQYDHFHTRIDRLYRVMENQQYTDGRLYTFSSTPGPMAPFIKDKFPEIELASRFTWQVNNLLQYKEKSFYEEGRYADQDFIVRYSFLNQDWENFYSAESQRGKVFNTLAVLSIFISCLGLFGLSAFSAERRTKELGIRKVLGATVPGLVQLMNREFAVLVAIAACIGCPVGWYIMDQWLSTYAYHIDVGLITLLVAAGVCLLIAVATVSYHSLRVATTEPVKSLRYE